MTNREWLNSLSNDELVEWIYAEDNMRFEKPEKEGGMCKVIYLGLHPHLHNVVLGWTSAYGRLKQWLDEEHKELEK